MTSKQPHRIFKQFDSKFRLQRLNLAIQMRRHRLSGDQLPPQTPAILSLRIAPAAVLSIHSTVTLRAPNRSRIEAISPLARSRPATGFKKSGAGLLLIRWRPTEIPFLMLQCSPA